MSLWTSSGFRHSHEPQRTQLAALSAVYYRFTSNENVSILWHDTAYHFHVEADSLLRDLFESESPLENSVDSGLRLYQEDNVTTLHFDSSKWHTATANTLFTSWCNILESGKFDCTVGEVVFPSARAQLDNIGVLATKKAHFPSDTGLGDLFHASALKHSAHIAVVSEDGLRQHSYGELDQMSDIVAQWALTLGLSSEAPIAVWSENSIDFIIATLGILKAGLACLPVDPRSPLSRVELILKDQQVDLVLHPGGSDISAFTEDVQSISLEAILSQSWPEVELRGKANGRSLAFYNYTSGSTGKPKGLMLEHRTLARVSFTPFTFVGVRPAPGQVWTNLSNNAWSFAQNEIFQPLLNGATVVPIPHDRVVDLPALASIFTLRKISVAFMVPALLAALCRQHPDALADVHMVVLSGDVASPDSVRTARAAFSGHLFNSWGSSETHFTSGFAVPSEGLDTTYVSSVPLGQPWPNMNMYILDSQKRLVPPGVIGTLWVASESLARGYTDPRLNRDTYFAAAEMPSVSEGQDDHRRFFRSGDQARWIAGTGQLEFLGRNDFEVKLRGQRIDLATVELALRRDMRVAEAAAVVQTDERDGERYLVAFIVPSEAAYFADTSLEQELQTTLSDLLPQFMVPSVIHSLDALPRMANDKIDRKTLISWTHVLQAEHDEAPLENGVQHFTSKEHAIIEIFSEILRVRASAIQPNSSFFVLGGHSLMATQVISRIRKAVGLDHRLSVRALFDEPTPAGLVRLIDSIASENQINLVEGPIPHLPEPSDGSYQLSYAQERLHFLESLHPGETAYVLPLVLRFTGHLDYQALSASLNDLLRRHEQLRVTYHTVDGASIQKVRPFTWERLLQVDLSVHDDPETALQTYLQSDSAMTFDISKDLPFRFKLYRLAQTVHVLRLSIHHIATDAWSDVILERELGLLYDAHCNQLPSPLLPPQITYMDYASWQRQPEQVSQQEEQLKYWLSVLRDSGPLEFPIDKPRPQVLSSSAGLERLDILGQDADALDSFAASMDATPFIVLLATLRLLHFRMTGLEDVTVGSPIANRNRIELEGLVGFFVNTQAMRIPVDGQMTFMELCKSVRGIATAAYDNQDVAFERLVHALQPDRQDLSRNPLVQVMIAVQPDEGAVFGGAGKKSLVVEKMETTPVTRFDLELHFVKRHDGTGYDGRILWSRDLFELSSIQRFASHFRALLRTAVSGHDASILLQEFPFFDAETSLDKLGLLELDHGSYPRERALGDLFKKAASLHAHRIAVRDKSGSLTYAELDALSDRVACSLRAFDLPLETLIGLFCERSISYITSILGILKAGLAYLPLDPQLPDERLQLLLEDLVPGSLVLVDQDDLSPSLHAVLDSRGLHIARIAQIQKVSNEHELRCEGLSSGSSLAYAMYTSGSTGRPKQVLIEHHSISRLAYDKTVIDAQPGQNWAHISNTAFDSSTWEIWCPLLNGGTVVCFEKMTVLDFRLLANAFKAFSIDVAFLTTALAAQCLHEVPALISTLEVLAMGGELCRASDVTMMSTLVRGHVCHVYGPTESTTYALGYRVPRDQTFHGLVPIGRPLSHTVAFVMDSQGCLVPPGVVGDLYLGGDGLARGYGDAEQTQKAFLEHCICGQKQRLYRTGDRVRWRAIDGQLEFLGRGDGQVKLRGQRIELGEIEHTLRSHPSIQNAAALLHGSQAEDKYIAAFVVPNTDDPSLASATISLSDEEKVSGWQGIFDSETYHDVDTLSDEQAGHDFVGWTRMFDGSPIPKTEMAEWLHDTVQAILELGPVGNVVEVGTGTGMILFNLKDHFTTYKGLDPAVTAVEFVKSKLSQEARKRIQVSVGTGIDLCKLSSPDLPDTFVINSVAQYFPSQDYLRSVIQQAVDLCAGHPAKMFLGDVRSLALSDLFFASYADFLLRQEGQSSYTTAQLQRRANSLCQSHTELLIHPQFFFDLQKTNPHITHVEILPKLMHSANELSQFRYQVVLWFYHPVTQVAVVDADSWKDYHELHWDLSQLEAAVSGVSGAGTLSIRSIPNSLLDTERGLATALRSSQLPSMSHTLQVSNNSLSAYQLIKLANRHGLRLDLSWARQDELFLDAVFYKAQGRRWHQFPRVHAPGLLTNVPAADSIVKPTFDFAELKSFLSTKLPTYMIPSRIEILSFIPVNANGKVDRRSLSEALSQSSEHVTNSDVVAPTSPSAELVKSTFESVLGITPLSATTSFFDAGGHSLLATRVVSRLQRIFDTTLSVRDLFNHPSPQELADLLDERKDSTRTPAYKPIPKAKRTELSPLSQAQARLMFLDQLNPGNTWWFINIPLYLKGNLNTAALTSAVRQLRCRHENLRSLFLSKDDTFFMKVVEGPNEELTLIDLQGSTDPDSALNDALDRENRTPFDLSSESPFRARLLRVRDDMHVLSLSIHHIVYDGYSLGIIYRELGQLYSQQAGLSSSELEPLPIQFRDFVEWERSLERQKLQEDELRYWVDILNGHTPAEFPPEKTRPDVLGAEAGLEVLTFDIVTSSKIEELSKKLAVTPFMTLFAVFRALHYRYTGAEDATMGTLNGNRSREEIEGLVGFFVDTQCLRVPVDSTISFSTLVRSASEVVRSAFDHQDVAFDKVVSALHPPRDLSKNPLVQVIFAVHSFSHDVRNEFPGLEARTAPPKPSTRMDFEFHVYKRDDGTYEGQLLYNQDLYSAAWAENLLRTFQGLLTSALSNPDTTISDLALTTAEEQLRDVGFNIANETPYPKESTLVDLLQEMVLKYPSAIAIEDFTYSLTYHELDIASDMIARALLESLDCLCGPETTVGIFARRSWQNIAAYYGVLKAGLAYIPLDPELPVSRLETLLSMPNAPTLILQCPSQKLPALKTQRHLVLLVDDILSNYSISQNKCGLPNAKCITPRSLAYIMYTSGSTGVPKGVMVEHKGIVRLVRDTNITDIKPGHRVAHLSALSFDASTFEIFSTLSNGGTLVVIDKETLLDPQALTAKLEQNPLQVAYFTAALFAQLIRSTPHAMKNVDLIITGGDVVQAGDVQEAYTLGAKRIIDAYGPTEDTVWSTFYEVPREGILNPRSIPIGRSISNSCALVIDNQNRLVPPGVIGELVLGGDGVARGYTDPAITKKSFVDIAVGGKNRRVYKSGDYVRVTAMDGTIEYLGRIDNQVKLRGQRVELREVELVLMRDASVDEAVALVHTNSRDEKSLVAFVTIKSDSPHSPARLRKQVAAVLPSVMVPSQIVIRQTLPLTTATKVDRKALARSLDDYEQLSLRDVEHIEPPSGFLEETIAAVFQSVLPGPTFGADDDFFERGGHSLLAIEVSSTLSNSIGMTVSVRDLYQASSPRSLAASIEGKLRGDANVTVNSQPGASLIRLKRMTVDKPSVFMVHDVFGLSTPYKALSDHLELNLFGFNDPYFGRDGFTSLQEMADHYANQITPTAQKLLLLGWSFGGTVAAEIALRFDTLGLPVHLILVDAPKVDTFTAVRVDIDEFIRRQGHPQGLAECLSREVHKNVDILRQHRLTGRLSGRSKVTFIKATKHPDEKDRDLRPEDGELFDERGGWKDTLADDWTTVLAPASHFELFKEPHVGVIADVLKTRDSPLLFSHLFSHCAGLKHSAERFQLRLLEVELDVRSNASDSPMNAVDDSLDTESLFGDSPPSTPRAGRSPSPGLALPCIQNAVTLLEINSQNVGTIALHGSPNVSELSNPLASSSRRSLSVSQPPTPSPSPAPNRDKDPGRKARKRTPAARQAADRPTPPPIHMPDPSQPPPTNFLRNQAALLGTAGMVSGVNPARLRHGIQRQGDTPSTPIVIDEDPIPSQVVPLSSSTWAPPVQVSVDDIMDSLQDESDVLPIFRNMFQFLVSRAQIGAQKSPLTSQVAGQVASRHGPPPTKKRKLSKVPAGAEDWDVPYPFAEGEGPSGYQEKWEKDRARKVVAQIVNLFKDAATKAAQRKEEEKARMERIQQEHLAAFIKPSASSSPAPSSAAAHEQNLASSASIDAQQSLDALLHAMLQSPPSGCLADMSNGQSTNLNDEAWISMFEDALQSPAGDGPIMSSMSLDGMLSQLTGSILPCPPDETSSAIPALFNPSPLPMTSTQEPTPAAFDHELFASLASTSTPSSTCNEIHATSIQASSAPSPIPDSNIDPLLLALSGIQSSGRQNGAPSFSPPPLALSPSVAPTSAASTPGPETPVLPHSSFEVGGMDLQANAWDPEMFLKNKGKDKEDVTRRGLFSKPKKLPLPPKSEVLRLSLSGASVGGDPVIPAGQPSSSKEALRRHDIVQRAKERRQALLSEKKKTDKEIHELTVQHAILSLLAQHYGNSTFPVDM